jgi:hypothetical protein
MDGAGVGWYNEVRDLHSHLYGTSQHIVRSVWDIGSAVIDHEFDFSYFNAYEPVAQTTQRRFYYQNRSRV